MSATHPVLALDEDRARVLHRRAAVAIDSLSLSAPDRGRWLGTLGSHWEMAGSDNRARIAYLAGARHFLGHYDQAEAERLYRLFVELLRSRQIPVEVGAFRAYMHVTLVNDGPVTLLLDSRKLF